MSALRTKIAELSLVIAALGNSVEDPLPESITPSLIVTSALPPRTMNRFTLAENRFLTESGEAIYAEKDEEDGPPMPPVARAASGEPRPPKKEKKSPLVTWRDPNACRATVIEHMNKSKHQNLTLLDMHGARLSMALATPTRTAAEGSLLSLTGVVGAEVSLIRSAVSGGAAIHGALKNNARLYYMSAMSERTLAKLRKKIPKQTRFNSWLNHTLMIPGDGRTPSELDLKEENFFWLLKNFLSGHDAKWKVEFEDSDAWSAFMERSAEDILERKLSSAAKQKLAEAPASVEAVLYHSLRLAIAEAALDAAKSGQVAEARVLRLTSAHLYTARIAAREMMSYACSLDVFDQRAENAANAREHLNVTPEMMKAAMFSLVTCIGDKEDGMVSRTEALRLRSVTPRAIDALIESGAIAEITGTSTIRKGRTARAYTLPGRLEPEPEEAESEFEAAKTSGLNLPESAIADAKTEVRKVAESNYRCGLGPHARLAQLKRGTIEALPALLPDTDFYFYTEDGETRVVSRFNNEGDELANWSLPLRNRPAEWSKKNQTDEV